MERTSISVRLNVISVFVCSSSARISKVGRSLIGRTMMAWLGGSEMARIVARQRFFSNNWGMNDGRMISPQKPSNPFRHISFEGIMQSIVGGSQPTVSRRPIKHESSGFSFLLHLLPNACQPTNLPVISLALTIDLHTYSYHRVITSTSSDQREITFAFVSYSYDLCIDSRQSKEQMWNTFELSWQRLGLKFHFTFTPRFE